MYEQVRELVIKVDPRFEGLYLVIGIEHGNKIKVIHLTDYTTRLALVDQLKRVF